MNILQIAQEIRSGKKVRRKCWYPDDVYAKRNGFDDHIVNKHNDTINLCSDDLSAIDWEVIEEKSPMELAWDSDVALRSNYDKGTHTYQMFSCGWNAAEKYFKSQK